MEREYGPLTTSIEPLPNLNVVVGTMQFIPIHTLRNIHGMYLYCTAVGVAATEAEMRADIGRIRVVIGGREIVNLTAADVFDIFHYYHDSKGAAAAWVPAGQLPILFMPQDFPWSGQARYYRIGMKANEDPADKTQNSMRVEVNWLAPGGGLTVDTVVPFLVTDDDAAETIGDHVRWLEWPSTHPTATPQQIDNLPRDKAAQAAMGYWFDIGVGTIGDFTVIASDVSKLRGVPVDVLNAEQWRAGRTPQAAWTRLGFDDLKDPSSLLPLSRLTNLTIIPNWTVLPGAYRIIRQEVHRGLLG